MKNIRWRCGVYAAVLVLFTVAAEAYAEEAAEPVSAREQSASVVEENIRRDVFARQDARLENARHLDDVYAEIKEFNAVLDELSNPVVNWGEEGGSRRIEILKELELLKLNYGRDLLRRARELSAAKNYSDAIALASEAMNVTIPYGETEVGKSPLENDGGALIDFCNRGVAGEKFKNATSSEQSVENYIDSDDRWQRYKEKNGLVPESGEEDRELRSKRIAALINESKTLYSVRRYEDAVSKLEEVFLIDPFQREAILMLNRIYRKIYTAGIHRHEADVYGQLSYGYWQWVEPVLPDSAVNEKLDEIPKDDSNNEMFTRLRQIVFPEVEFSDISLRDVVGFLRDKSKTYDPSGIGVDISWSASGGGDMFDKVNIGRLSNIPLSEILEYLHETTGVNYRVSQSGVDVGPSVELVETLEMNIRTDIVNSLLNVGGEALELGDPDSDMGVGNSSGEPDDIIDKKPVATENMSLEERNSKLREYLSNIVDFQESDKVSYNPMTGKLSVTTTPRNIKALEDFVKQVNAVEPPMVLIEVKSMELGENEMQEFGFNWGFDKLIGGLDKMGEETARHWEFGYSDSESRPASIRDVKEFSSAVINKLDISKAIFGSQNIFGSDNPLSVTLTINALNRNTKSETLNAPKVLANSGETATVKLVTSYYFPEDWDTYEIEMNNGVYTLTYPVPDFGEESDIGLIFTVTPQVDPDNYTISLHLVPTMTSYVGQDTYSMTVYGYEYNRDGEPVESNKDMSVWMPIISRRSLDVYVDTYDGETVVLGGMIDSTVSTYNDKLPFLGDLPFIGRFFSSDYEESDRVNLLVFVTARLVNQYGVPLNPSPNVGAPSFFNR